MNAVTVFRWEPLHPCDSMQLLFSRHGPEPMPIMHRADGPQLPVAGTGCPTKDDYGICKTVLGRMDEVQWLARYIQSNRVLEVVNPLPVTKSLAEAVVQMGFGCGECCPQLVVRPPGEVVPVGVGT